MFLTQMSHTHSESVQIDNKRLTTIVLFLESRASALHLLLSRLGACACITSVSCITDTREILDVLNYIAGKPDTAL